MSASRSSRGEPSWGGSLPIPRGTDRGQTEPIAALAAVLAVVVGLALFAGVAADVPAGPERSVAEPALERAAASVLADGVVDPGADLDLDALAPEGYRANVTVAWSGGRRSIGPPAPPSADRASRPVTVAVAPGDLRPGRLVVEVWP